MFFVTPTYVSKKFVIVLATYQTVKPLSNI